MVVNINSKIVVVFQHLKNYYLLFHNTISLRGAGAFSRDFTTNLTPQCRVFSQALKTEKLNAPLFPGLDTNDWCIINIYRYMYMLVGCKYLSGENLYHRAYIWAG